MPKFSACRSPWIQTRLVRVVGLVRPCARPCRRRTGTRAPVERERVGGHLAELRAEALRVGLHEWRERLVERRPRSAAAAWSGPWSPCAHSPQVAGLSNPSRADVLAHLVRDGGRCGPRGRGRRTAPCPRSSSSKPNRSMFSAIRAGVTDLGITIVPSCRCQRSTTCAGVPPCFSASPVIDGVGEHAALGDRAPRLGGDPECGVGRADLAPAGA